MSDPSVQEARKTLYQKLKRDNPEGDRQLMKQMAYDLSQQAVKNLMYDPRIADAEYLKSAGEALRKKLDNV